MKTKALVSALFAGLFFSSLASAADFGASLDVGTTGLGLHVATPLATNLNARVGVNYASYSYDSNTSDVSYDFKLKLATVDALLDYHPFASGFRVSGGLVYDGNKIEAHAKPNGDGTFTINGNTYSASTAGNIGGNIDFRKAAPYVGIGYGNAVTSTGWGFAMDLGAIFQGSPKSQLSSTGCTATAADCAQLANDVAAENAKLDDKVHSFRAYPVIRVGLTYKF